MSAHINFFCEKHHFADPPYRHACKYEIYGGGLPTMNACMVFVNIHTRTLCMSKGV